MFHLTTALDAASAVPLYEQLYQSLAAEMRAGAIPAGTRMPGKRRLAAELSVSVNTVDAAYQILAAEGLSGAKGAQRLFMYRNIWLCLPGRNVLRALRQSPWSRKRLPGRPHRPLRRSAMIFPRGGWTRRSSRSVPGRGSKKELLYSSPELLTHGDAQGDWELRQALADYLEEYRGVQCSPQQIVVGAGLEYLLGLLAPLLPGKAAVETPGYPRAKQVLENNGVECCCLPVDEGRPFHRRTFPGPGRRSATLPPATSSPTGVTMPAGRRPSCSTGRPSAPGSGTSSRTTTTPSSGSTPAHCPACRGWPGPTAR